MKVFYAIVATAVSLFTLWMVIVTICFADLAFAGFWPTSWKMYFRAMNMEHVTSHQYFQGLNATCLAISLISLPLLARFCIDLFRKVRR